MKHLTKLVAAAGIVTLALAGCGGGTTSNGGGGASEAKDAATFKACAVSDAGGWDDKSFNESAYNGLKAKVSVTSVSAAPSGAVPVESLTGTSGAVPLSPRAAVEQVYDAAVKAGKGGSVVINAVPAAQSVKGGKVGALRELTQDELSAYLNDSAVQKSRSNRFDSSYLLCKEKDGSTTVVWYESEADIAEKTELCKLLGIKTVYVLK